MESKFTCQSCGQNLDGKYCKDCGEKVVDRSEQTLRHFFGEVISAFTFADNKVWKTLKYLFFKPGQLPELYIKGRRKQFISPLPLFLLINLLYFLFSPLDTFNSYFLSQIGSQPYSALIHDYGLQQLAKSGMGEAEFSIDYNAHSLTISKSIILLIPILFAFPLWALFYKKSSYLFDHLMFAITFMSFILLGVFFILPLLIIIILKISLWLELPLSFDWNGSVAIVILLGTLIGYLSISVFRFYKQSVALSIFKIILLLISFVLLVYFYRFVLFFLTLWTM